MSILIIAQKTEKLSILIHPKSYIHAILIFNNAMIKVIAHDTTMEIPIFNSLHQNYSESIYKNKIFNFKNLNGLNFVDPDYTKFPCLKLLKFIKVRNTYFEIILVSINDELVKKYLKDQISFITMQKNLLKLIKEPYFTKYYNRKPNNINDIKNMVDNVVTYLNKIKFNEI